MNTPLYNMLISYQDKKPIPFHMPGHLLGRGLSDFIKDAGLLDITEIPGSDNLHAPEGVIGEAQELAASLFGARKTFFLVNGSTIGIHAMMNASVKPGGKVLVGRDCHRSVLNALVLLDAKPVFVMPQYDERQQLPLGYNIDDILKTLDENTDIEAVVLTRPNYYGIASRLDGFSEAIRSRGMPLLIDEAHGAHFSFHLDFPESSLKKGADICVQSLHKTLPALTQTALLHVNENSLVDSDKLAAHIAMLQTTSPSYVLMASIDLMRERMEQEGHKLYDKLQLRVNFFKEQLALISGIELASIPEGVESDFSRIVISLHKSGLTGYQVEQFLRERKSIVAEMADLNHVVFIATPYHTEKDFETLVNGLKEIAGDSRHHTIKKKTAGFPKGLPEKKLGLREAVFAASEWLPLSRIAGKVCAEALVPYPPGIPLVYPGEIIHDELLEYVNEILDSGGSVHGIMGNMVRVVK